MKSFKFALAILAITVVGFSSCKKEKDEIDNDTESVIENAVADAAFNDVANIAEEGYTGSLSSYRGGKDQQIYTTCATVSFDTTATPKKFTIDFGSTNCLCNDQINRRGKIIVSYVGFYKDSGSTHTITFDNYYVNNNKIEGTKTVKNGGRNSAGNLTFSVTVNGSIIWDPSTYGGGGTSTYNSSRTREWIAGESTSIWSDDVYLISGTSSGTTRSGGSYTLNTSEPLKVEIGYRHFTDGILEFTPSGKKTRIIDYGYPSGGRDSKAQVTIGNLTFVVDLR
jgi:hypothetical protein